MPVTPIKGYKEQPQEVLDAVNENKIAEERILRTFDLMLEAKEELGDAYDFRAFAIAQTKFQEAFMWFNRGLLNPSRIALPEDSE